MKTVGFPISKKENENRRALFPNDLIMIRHPELIFVEKNYGKVLGFSDDEYIKYGAQIDSREEILKKNIICDPKIGDAEYLSHLKNQTIFGWIHAIQNKHITDSSIKGKLTDYAWEEMYENGRHIFYRNNEIDGESEIVHAYVQNGFFP